MENKAEIIDIITFYEILKKDIHALLVRKSKFQMDYRGKLRLCEKTAILTYDCSSSVGLNGILRIDNKWISILKDMINADIMIWNKTSKISDMSLVYHDGCTKVNFAVNFI